VTLAILSDLLEMRLCMLRGVVDRREYYVLIAI